MKIIQHLEKKSVHLITMGYLVVLITVNYNSSNEIINYILLSNFNKNFLDTLRRL